MNVPFFANNLWFPWSAVQQGKNTSYKRKFGTKCVKRHVGKPAAVKRWRHLRTHNSQRTSGNRLFSLLMFFSIPVGARSHPSKWSALGTAWFFWQFWSSSIFGSFPRDSCVKAKQIKVWNVSLFPPIRTKFSSLSQHESYSSLCQEVFSYRSSSL